MLIKVNSINEVTARRAAPQHLHQQPAAARRNAAAQKGAAHPLRRPDHRLRRLCGIGGGRPARRPLRRRGGRRQTLSSAAAHHRAGRAARPHHRRRRRGELPADERQFRPLPATGRRPHEESGPQEALYRPAREPTWRRGWPSLPPQIATWGGGPGVTRWRGN